MSSTLTSENNEHIKPLDSLRAIAALSVVIYHYQYVFYTQSEIGSFPKYFYSFFNFGWLGVDLFFVLSGFLITKILISKKESKGYFKIFYTRRSLRIFPLYYTVLAGYFLLPLAFGRPSIASSTVTNNQFWLWTYMANIPYPNRELGDLGHFWTLSVEEHFYLIWPLLVRYLPTKGLKTLCLYSIPTIFLLRLGLYFNNVDFSYITRSTICRIDTILFGSLLAIYSLNKPDKHISNLSKKLILFSTPATLLFILSIGYTNIGSNVTLSEISQLVMYPFFSILFTGLIGYVSFSQIKDQTSHWLNNPALLWIGRISYGIYIFHLPLQRVYSLLQQVLYPSLPMYYDNFFIQIAWISIQMIGTIIFSALSWVFFEKFFIQLKDRITDSSDKNITSTNKNIIKIHSKQSLQYLRNQKQVQKKNIEL